MNLGETDSENVIKTFGFKGHAAIRITNCCLFLAHRLFDQLALTKTEPLIDFGRAEVVNFDLGFLMVYGYASKNHH